MQKTEKDRKEVFNRIISLIIEDPQEGLNQFYSEYGKLIQVTTKKVCKTEDKTKSAINCVLVKIWRAASKLDNIENPDGWVYKVALNCAKNEIKEKFLLSINEHVIKNTQDPIKEIIDLDSFNYLIEDLKEKEQKVMILRFVSGYSFQDIAKSLKKPLSTVTSIFYRALDKIKNSTKIDDFE